MTLSALAAVLMTLVAVPLPTDAQKTVGSLFEPGETQVWVLEQKGQRLGTHWFRYEGPVGLMGGSPHRFTAGVTLDLARLGGADQRFQGDLLVDDEGRPIRHVFRAQMGANLSRVEMTFEGEKMHAVVQQGPSPRTIDGEVPARVFLQANNFIGYFDLLFRLAWPSDGTPLEVSLVSANMLKSFPYRAGLAEPEGGKSEDGTTRAQDSLGETLFLDSRGSIERIEVAAQSLVIRRSDETASPFTLADPEVETRASRGDFHREEVEIRHGEVTLAGTITRPLAREGRLPAVFFISGSGLQDREGFSSGIDLGTHEILDRLTEEGFLVLRVDDRGVGGSTGVTRDLGFDDLVADARACVDFLFTRDDVDSRRVALIGHSEGGVTAPILAGENSRIAAVVLLAAPGRGLIEILMEQNAQALDTLGLEGEERTARLAEIRTFLDRITSDEEIDPESVPADLRSGFALRTWLQQHARQDVLANARKLRCPVLVLQGAKDFQVSAERDSGPLSTAIVDAGNKDCTRRVFPDLDHLFKNVEGEESKLTDYFEKRPVDAEFLDVLVAWLKERLRG